MKNLQDKIKLLYSDNSLIDSLDIQELKFIDELITELNQSGRNHTINKITKKSDQLSVETIYSVTWLKN